MCSDNMRFTTVFISMILTSSSVTQICLNATALLTSSVNWTVKEAWQHIGEHDMSHGDYKGLGYD